MPHVLSSALRLYGSMQQHIKLLMLQHVIIVVAHCTDHARVLYKTSMSQVAP